MKSPKVNPSDSGFGKRGNQFGVAPSELGSSKCNDSFRTLLQGGIEGGDADYKMFLEYLTGSCEQRETVGAEIDEEEEKEEEEEEDEVDPNHKMFLNRLIPCGKSYALNVHGGSGMLVLVKYHGVDDSDEYWDSPAQRKMSKEWNNGEEMHGAKKLRNFRTHQRPMNATEDLRNVEDPRKAQKQKISRSNWGREKVQKVTENKLRPKTINHNSHGAKASPRQRFAVENYDTAKPLHNCEIDDKEIDGSYQVFLNGIENEGEEICGAKNLRNFGTHQRPMNATEDLNVEDPRKAQKRKILRSDWGREKVQTVAEKKLRPETINHNSHGSKASPRQRFDVENYDIPKPQPNCEIDNIEIDGCYQVFLNGIENEGECIVFVHDGQRVKYDDYFIDNDSDSEIMVLDHDPFLRQENNNPLPTKVNFSVDGEEIEKEVSPFRRKIMRILKRPYSKKEYRHLSREVKVRKPMVVHREMRRPKSVLVDKLGKSYLDHHPDLKEMIDAVRGDRPKELNILRGFFFWLNNTCYEGKKFKPWRDALCLAVVPPSNR